MDMAAGSETGRRARGKASSTFAENEASCIHPSESPTRTVVPTPWAGPNGVESHPPPATPTSTLLPKTSEGPATLRASQARGHLPSRRSGPPKEPPLTVNYSKLYVLCDVLQNRKKNVSPTIIATL